MKARRNRGVQAAAAASPEAARERILAAVRRIPRGRVSTYGWIATVAGLAGRARLVGTCLRDAPDDPDLPWHRVVNASGRLSLPEGSPARVAQRARLEAEGIVFIGGRISLARCGWPAPNVDIDAMLWGPPRSR